MQKSRPLRIAIDAHMVGEHETGNETYILNLMRGLMDIDQESRYLMYSPHVKSLGVLNPLPRNFAPVQVKPATSVIRIPIGLPARVRADRADILHVTYVAPPIVSARVVATVHDISYVYYPETFSARDKAILNTFVPRTLRKADAVITVSESSKRDIVSHYGTPQEKITVVYQSIAPTFRVLPRDAALRARLAPYGIKGPYILAVGNLQPRKNLYRLILAYARLLRNGTYRGDLVVVGKSKWQESSLFQTARNLGLDQRIKFTGYVTDEDLVAIYNGADVFVYPSLYEGFGLPPLEAMACGCPVVASDGSSLPEVVGDAGLLTRPTSDDAIAWVISRLVIESGLRDTLIQRGLERVRRFSMRVAAATTLQVYNQIADRRATPQPDKPRDMSYDASYLSPPDVVAHARGRMRQSQRPHVMRGSTQ